MTTLVTEPPAPATVPDWAFPVVTRTSRDGVDVVAAHLAARPLVRVAVVLGSGALTDEVGREGVASLLGSAALRGAGGLDEHALAVAFERVGAVPGITVRYERTELALEVPAPLLREAMARLADVLRRPTLAPAEIERVRDARIDRLRARHTNAGFRAGRAAARGLWVPSSRYAVPAGGSVEALSAIGPEHVTAAHDAVWRDAAVAVVLAGDLTGVDIEDVIGPLTGGTGTPAEQATTVEPDGTGLRIQLVDVPGSVQSVIEARAPGPPALTGDDAGLEVATTALFGSFSSRLNLRLREELGYTYGSNGGFARLRDVGWSRAGCSVRTEVTADAVAELVGVLRAGVDEGLDDDEVAAARENLVRKFPVRYDGPDAVAGALIRRVHRGLDDGERDMHLRRLRAVTTESANDALRASLAADDLVVTVAGAADDVRDALVALDLGPVRDVD